LRVQRSVKWFSDIDRALNWSSPPVHTVGERRFARES